MWAHAKGHWHAILRFRGNTVVARCRDKWTIADRGLFLTDPENVPLCELCHGDVERERRRRADTEQQFDLSDSQLSRGAS